MVLAAALADDRPRRALVIDNGTYEHAGTLAGADDDARLVAAALREVGFVVTRGSNLDRAAFYAAVESFRESLPPRSVVVLYYAGHGYQMDGQNYLFAVDANPLTRADAKAQGLEVEALFGSLAAADYRVLILDACRANPFADRPEAELRADMDRGWAPEEARGAIYAYATAAGELALDGGDEPGPYASALADHLGDEGAWISGVLDEVGADVAEATDGRMTPEYRKKSSSTREFCPVSCPEGLPPPPPRSGPGGTWPLAGYVALGAAGAYGVALEVDVAGDELTVEEKGSPGDTGTETTTLEVESAAALAPVFELGGAIVWDRWWVHLHGFAGLRVTGAYAYGRERGYGTSVVATGGAVAGGVRFQPANVAVGLSVGAWWPARLTLRATGTWSLPSELPLALVLRLGANLPTERGPEAAGELLLSWNPGSRAGGS